MKALKTTVTLKVKVLDLRSASNLLEKAAASIRNEADKGKIDHTDGDVVRWKTKYKQVKF